MVVVKNIKIVMASSPNKDQLASRIEATLLKPTTSLKDIELLCKEVVANKFHGVCIPPYFVQAASRFLNNTDRKVITVVGFPLGYNNVTIKGEEAKKAIADGAHELDMVINLAALKSEQFGYLQEEIRSITTLCRMHSRLVKVIIETAVLTPEEMLRLCEICIEEKVDFVKTSTGFASRGVSVEDIIFLRQNLPASISIKASGGIREKAFALELIAAGADRLGTSASVEIIKI